MKRVMFVVVVLLVIGIMACDSFKKWEPYESKDGWFRAEFPGRPRVERTPLATKVGTVSIHMVSVSQRKGVYGIGYLDFPEIGTNMNLESDEFIDSMAQGSFSSIGTGQYNKKVIDFEGYPGLEAEGEVKSGSVRGLARIRYYVVEKRIYMLEVIGENSFVNSGNTDKFFNSFRLVYSE